MLGYRERKQVRAQQAQQAFGNSVQSEQRITVPVPTSINLRDGTRLPPTDSPYLLNVVGTDRGVRLMKERQLVGWLDNIRDGRETACALVTYDGSGSASAEMWCMYYTSGTAQTFMSIANIGAMVESGVTATASAILTVNNAGMCDTLQKAEGGSWVQFKKTIIYVNGSQCNNSGVKWTRANGWDGWSASTSGVSASVGSNNHWGIYAFKNRLYTWSKGNSEFTYGSVDQIVGVHNRFQLGAVLGQNVMFMTSMTRDGGAGPDDFAVFVGEDGKVAVYQGSNPGDATDWSLVGVYQIGKPVSKDGWIKSGNQVIVACEDDFYVLPDDLQGTRQGKKTQRQVRGDGENPYWDKKHRHFLNAVRESNRGLVMFGDGTTLNVKRGLEGSHTQVSSAEPYTVYTTEHSSANPGIRYANLGVYKNRIFAVEPGDGGPSYQPNKIYEIDANKGTKYSNNKVYFGELPTQGRANTALVNPVIRKLNSNSLSTSTSTPSSLVYRLAAVYDDDLVINTSVDTNLWLTASAELSGTFGSWAPLFGTGDAPQVAFEVLSASSSAEFIFTKLNVTVSDTGGL